MLKFYGQYTNVDHYYLFSDENCKLYYWKNNNSAVYNSCFLSGKLIGINVLKYEVKMHGENIIHDGKNFEQIKVIKWEKCS